MLIRFLFCVVIFLHEISFCSENHKYKKIMLEVLEIAKEHSINSKKLDWSTIEAKILQQTAQIRNDNDLYNTLQSLISMIDDKHSYLITADGMRLPETEGPGNKKTVIKLPLDKLKNTGIAYIEVNPLSSGLISNMTKYAENLYNKIVSSYDINMTGWILDFRENTGGQLWPMLAGLSLLINSDIAGNAIYPNEQNWSWWAKSGKAGVGKNIHHQVTSDNKPSIMKKPIAILISKKTASSGEASVISFLGQDNICLIGEQTRGLATINQPFELSNCTTLMLTTAYFGDRNKKIYPNGIEPNIEIYKSNENETDNDIQLETAIEWLGKHK